MTVFVYACVQTIQDVPPSKFKCSTNSPVQPEIWSNTNPKVALTHMFCGQIVNGVAQGVHGLPNNAPPLDVVEVRNRCVGYEGFHCYVDTYVWNANAKPAAFVHKVNPPNVKDQLFFPGNIEGTVNYLVQLYNTPACKNIIQANSRYCVEVFRNNILNHVTVLVTNRNDKNIRTAWPIRLSERSGNRCTANNTCAVKN